MSKTDIFANFMTTETFSRRAAPELPALLIMLGKSIGIGSTSRDKHKGYTNTHHFSYLFSLSSYANIEQKIRHLSLGW